MVEYAACFGAAEAGAATVVKAKVETKARIVIFFMFTPYYV
jgi:hypothetical protein